MNYAGSAEMTANNATERCLLNVGNIVQRGLLRRLITMTRSADKVGCRYEKDIEKLVLRKWGGDLNSKHMIVVPQSAFRGFTQDENQLQLSLLGHIPKPLF